MTAMSNYLENKILDHVLGTTAFTFPSQAYLALYTSNPGEGNTGTEVSGSGYARQTADFDAAASGATQNNGAISFTASGGNWGSITHWALFDASSAGNMLIYGAFNTAKTINDGDTLTINDGDLDVTAD